jgi:EAL domain-containing protein (putative c-di-GMP-specific phosphodiesterase class I)/GGDEF domain-containing protein
MPASWRKARRLIHRDDRRAVEQQIREALTTRKGLSVQLRLLVDSGAPRNVTVDSEIECDAAGETLGMTCTVQDVTERLRAEQRIHALRYYDRATQLPNLVFLREHLEHLLPLARRRGYRIGVLAVGFTELARLLAPLGRLGMDALMRQIGEVLVGAVRDADTVALIPGPGFGDDAAPVQVTRADNDTFCVVLSAIDRPEVAGAVAGRLLSALRRPLSIDGAELTVDARIGVAVFPEDGPAVDLLLDHADNALAQAIEHDDETVAFFSSTFHDASRQRIALESALRRAVEHGELELHYQPKLTLAGGRPTGCEALLRWRHARHGLIRPQDFIPLAEESGLIVPIGRWVVDAALAELAVWRRHGLDDLGVAINVSPRQLQDPGFIDALAGALRTHGVPGAAVEIEIVESMMVSDKRRAHAFIGAVHELGARVALDDFGTGYSSLSYLRQFAIDVLKLDRSFLVGVPEDAAANAIAGGIIALARALRLEVVAEGVELQSQFEFLRTLHCDQVQGYLITRPQAAPAIRDWLTEALVVRERARQG